MAQRLNAHAARVSFLVQDNHFLVRVIGHSSGSFELSGIFL